MKPPLLTPMFNADVMTGSRSVEENLRLKSDQGRPRHTTPFISRGLALLNFSLMRTGFPLRTLTKLSWAVCPPAEGESGTWRLSAPLVNSHLLPTKGRVIGVIPDKRLY